MGIGIADAERFSGYNMDPARILLLHRKRMARTEPEIRINWPGYGSYSSSSSYVSYAWNSNCPTKHRYQGRA